MHVLVFHVLFLILTRPSLATNATSGASDSMSLSNSLSGSSSSVLASSSSSAAASASSLSPSDSSIVPSGSSSADSLVSASASSGSLVSSGMPSASSSSGSATSSNGSSLFSFSSSSSSSPTDTLVPFVATDEELAHKCYSTHDQCVRCLSGVIIANGFRTNEQGELVVDSEQEACMWASCGQSGGPHCYPFSGSLKTRCEASGGEVNFYATTLENPCPVEPTSAPGPSVTPLTIGDGVSGNSPLAPTPAPPPPSGLDAFFWRRDGLVWGYFATDGFVEFFTESVQWIVIVSCVVCCCLCCCTVILILLCCRSCEEKRHGHGGGGRHKDRHHHQHKRRKNAGDEEWDSLGSPRKRSPSVGSRVRSPRSVAPAATSSKIESATPSSIPERDFGTGAIPKISITATTSPDDFDEADVEMQEQSMSFTPSIAATTASPRKRSKSPRRSPRRSKTPRTARAPKDSGVPRSASKKKAKASKTRCINCNHKLAPPYKFCSECGQSQQSAKQQRPVASPSTADEPAPPPIPATLKPIDVARAPDVDDLPPPMPPRPGEAMADDVAEFDDILAELDGIDVLEVADLID